MNKNSNSHLLNLTWPRLILGLSLITIPIFGIVGINVHTKGFSAGSFGLVILWVSAFCFFVHRLRQLRNIAISENQPLHAVQLANPYRSFFGPKAPAAVWFLLTILIVFLVPFVFPIIKGAL